MQNTYMTDKSFSFIIQNDYIVNLFIDWTSSLTASITRNNQLFHSIVIKCLNITVKISHDMEIDLSSSLHANHGLSTRSYTSLACMDG